MLAKINGVAKSDGVQPGQMLKVVRGPFSATVDLSDKELFLTVDGRYAGKFPVQVTGPAALEGSFKVAEKKTGPSAAERSVVMKSDTMYGPEVVLSTTSSTPAYGPTGRISVADRDLGDLYDILSEGSSVTIRR